MPIFKASDKLILYAHVPKCGGSSVSWYLHERFGALAFNDPRHTQRNPATVWSKTSPQHIDALNLSHLFPPGFFDAVFTIVRHPVSRIVSAYHFQLEVERSLSTRTSFSDWLEDMEEMRAEFPFANDNHSRPMSEIVPEGAHVFHMEHGLDALVPWFDSLTGSEDGPRAVAKMSERGRYAAPKSGQVDPSDWDLELISRIYAADFERFGYSLDSRMPHSPAPELPAGLDAERDLLQRRANNPVRRISRKLSKRMGL